MSDQETPKSEETQRIEQQVEDQVRSEVGQDAGVGEPPTWEETGRRIAAKIRAEMANLVGAHPDATWREVGQSAGGRTKAALGGWAGATASDDWETVGRKIETDIRRRTARTVGVEQANEADWDAIGHRVESRMRGGIGHWVGAAPGADWATIGRQFDARVRTEVNEVFAGAPRTQSTGAAAGQEAEKVQNNPQREEFHVAGGDVVDKVKELIHEGNVRRVIIKQGERVLVEFPLTLGVVGAVFAPVLAAVGAMAALIADCTIVVEREA